jgi:hypothetical protein
MRCFYAIRPDKLPGFQDKAAKNKEGTHIPQIGPATQRIARIDRALCTPYIAAQGLVKYGFA